MPNAIVDFCRTTGQKAPATKPEFTRCVLDSLAMKYCYVLSMLERVTEQPMSTIRIVGGGAKNRLLNRLTASATGRRVIAGPMEATALGNIAVQMIAIGEVGTLSEARQIVDRSFRPEIFDPDIEAPWDDASQRFNQYCMVR
jgi:sugar (pentulose or hexulose) kinase